MTFPSLTDFTAAHASGSCYFSKAYRRPNCGSSALLGQQRSKTRRLQACDRRQVEEAIMLLCRFQTWPPSAKGYV